MSLYAFKLGSEWCSSAVAPSSYMEWSNQVSKNIAQWQGLGLLLFLFLLGLGFLETTNIYC